MTDLLLIASLAVALVYLGGLIDLSFMELEAQKEANHLENIEHFQNKRIDDKAGKGSYDRINRYKGAGQIGLGAANNDFKLAARTSRKVISKLNIT